MNTEKNKNRIKNAKKLHKGHSVTNKKRAEKCIEFEPPERTVREHGSRSDTIFLNKCIQIF